VRVRWPELRHKLLNIFEYRYIEICCFVRNEVRAYMTGKAVGVRYEYSEQLMEYGGYNFECCIEVQICGRLKTVLTM